MLKYLARALLLLPVLLYPFASDARASDATRQAQLNATVNATIPPLMKKYGIPGMAVAVTIDGGHFFFNFGVQSKKSQKPVTETTLFEIGSVSKTFTAALAAFAQALGQISLTESVSAAMPSLSESAFDRIRMLDLAIHTSGGLPLQVPDSVANDEQLLDYFKTWEPPFAAGMRRNYSNMSVGLLGLATTQSLNEDFVQAVAAHLFVPLGLTHTYYDVPESALGDCAQGYNNNNAPVRMRSGPLAAEAYGVKSCTRDLLRWLEANMGLPELDAPLQQALNLTHTGYVAYGDIIQGLVWEQYRLPTTLRQLLEGNAIETILGNAKAEQVLPPLIPEDAVLLNKTGSTSGFGAYVLFIPARKTGIVLLANKNYPNEARVSAAWRILTALHAHGLAGK